MKHLLLSAIAITSITLLWILHVKFPNTHYDEIIERSNINNYKCLLQDYANRKIPDNQNQSMPTTNKILIMEIQVCKGAIVRFKSRTHIVGNKNIVLQAFLDDKKINELLIQNTGKRTHIIRIKNSGILRIFHFNRHYVAQERIAYLEHFKFKGKFCNSINVVKNSNYVGGDYYSARRTWVVAYLPPPSFIPCSKGKLSFSMRGLKVFNKYPTIDLVQGNRVVFSENALNHSKKYTLELKKQEVYIVVRNPYGKVEHDQKILLSDISISYNSSKTP